MHHLSNIYIYKHKMTYNLYLIFSIPIIKNVTLLWDFSILPLTQIVDIMYYIIHSAGRYLLVWIHQPVYLFQKVISTGYRININQIKCVQRNSAWTRQYTPDLKTYIIGPVQLLSLLMRSKRNINNNNNHPQH